MKVKFNLVVNSLYQLVRVCS